MTPREVRGYASNLAQLNSEAALASLHTSRDGLSFSEAKRRLDEFGPNALKQARGDDLLKRLLKSFTHLFALLLWFAAGIAFMAEVNQPGQGMGTLGTAIIGVILINGLFAFWQEFQTERILSTLARLLPMQVKVVREGTVMAIPTAELVPGDIIFLRQGDSVPADGRLIEARAVRVSNASVTGESMPLERTAKPSLSEDPLHSENIVLAGTSIVTGEGVAMVFATAVHTEFGKIAHLAQATGAVRTPFLNEVTRLSRVIAILSITLGVTVFAIGLHVGLSLWQSFMFGIGIIVANVPEGLLPTITLALAMGARRMARRKVLIRHLPAVEALGSATVICTDKTGTLTENRMAPCVIFRTGTQECVGPEGLAPEKIEIDRRLCEIARWCNSLQPGVNGDWLGDPMEVALARMALKTWANMPAWHLSDETPFDPDRRRMSTVHATPSGPVVCCKGATESVLPVSSRVLTANGPVPLTPSTRDRITAAEDKLARRGLRVLALAYRPGNEGPESAEQESDLILVGLVGFEDPPRAGVSDAVRSAETAGIRVIIATGDHPQTTVAVARQIGLVKDKAANIITGEDLQSMSDAQLQIRLDASPLLFARLHADQKLRLVRALQAMGHTVAVTGDGVNDAPALKQADIGIAMGRSGSDVAREAADMILIEDNFANIIDAVEEGRAVFDNVRKFMTYILASNIPEIVPYLAFALLGIPLPLTIIQILAVDLGTDMVPAIALGAERPDSAVMRRAPRSRTQRLLNWPLLARAYLFLGPIEAVAGMAAYFFVLGSAGWMVGTPLDALDPLYREATTACFGAIVVTQIVNVLLCRNEQKSIYQTGLGENRLIAFGIAIEVTLVVSITYTEWGNAIFGTAPLSPETWLFMLPFAAAMLAAEEGRKWFVRRNQIESPERSPK